MKTSSLDSLYEGLPVVIVKDWAEITEECLEKWTTDYKNLLESKNYKFKLTNQYWTSKIKFILQNR